MTAPSDIPADPLRLVAQLTAAGHDYPFIARSLGTTPQRVYWMAAAGARLLLQEGTAPEELRAALAALPPLKPPPKRRSRPQHHRKPLAALADAPAPSDVPDALTATLALDDLAIPQEDLQAITADPPALYLDEPGRPKTGSFPDQR